MRLVTLTSGVSVNPDHVASVTVNSVYDTITVRLVDGKEFHFDRTYGKTVWETHDNVTAALVGEPS